MIRIEMGSVAVMQEEGQTLLDEHYQELTLNKDVVKLDVDWPRYQRLEKLGSLVCFVARLNGVLIGYSVFIYSFHMHYKTCKMASNDVLFLKKEYRTKSSAGLKLLRFAEEYLKNIGVTKILYHVKKSNNFNPILERMGFAHEEYIMGKILR